MGKNVLKCPGVFLGYPSTLLRLAIVLVAFVGVMSAKLERVSKQLNLTGISHVSQWNISQTEYETKYREYFDLVERNQRRRLNSSASYDSENTVRKKLYTFTHSGLKNSPLPRAEILNLNYDVHIPKEINKRTEVEETSLRLLIVPTICDPHQRTLTLEVSKPGSGRPFKNESFFLDKCLPKWIGLDLTEGLNASPQSNYRVSVRCEGCPKRAVRLRDPYLNVIVSVKDRLRRRRAEKKRRRFQGKCERHPWEVDLGKLKGYEYIVQPRKFNAGLCAGKCTAHWTLATQHSNLQYLFSNIDKSIPRPCCSPVKMERLEILHHDEDNLDKLKLSVWDDTKIVECGCS